MKKMKSGNLGASTDAIYLIFVRLITIVLGFAISRILSQYLSKYDYGTYSQAMLIVSTVASITILGMADAVNFFFCKEVNKDKRENFVATIFAMQYIAGVISAVMLVILAVPLCKYFRNDGLKPFILVIAVAPMFQNLLSMLQVLFISIGKSKIIALRNFIYSILKLCVVSVACILIKSVILIVIVNLVLDILQYLLFINILHRNNCYFGWNKVNFALIKTILFYSVPMAAFMIISTISRDMDKYVISNFMNTEALAVYSNAARLLPFDIIMSSFCTVLLPYITSFIARKKWKEASILYKNFLQLTYISTCILACSVLVSAPEFMKLLYTSKYLEGIQVFCIYILVDIIRFTNITLVLSAAGKTNIIMIISAIGLVLNFIMNILFFNIFGFEGPAIATLVVTIIIGILMLFFNGKVMRVSIESLFDIKHICVFVLECIIVGVASKTVNNILSLFDVNYIVIIIISSGMFFAIMAGLNYKTVFSIMKEIEMTKLESIQ